MRLIDADKIELNYIGLAYIDPLDFVGTAKYFADQIKAATTIDAEPVRHGHWIETIFPYGCKQYRCSNCIEDEWWNGKFAYGDEHYCPNRGAKMDGGFDE